MTKMEQEEFLCDLALIYDTLEEISHLSLNLQERGMTLTRADTLMRRTIRMVSSMITCPGDRRQEALQAAEKHEFNGIQLRSTPRARQMNSEFLHSLMENLEERLFTTGSARQ